MTNKNEDIVSGELGIFGLTPIGILNKTTHNELRAYIAIRSFQGNSKNSYPDLIEISQRAGWIELDGTETEKEKATKENTARTKCSLAIQGLIRKKLIIRNRRYGATNIYRCIDHFESAKSIAEKEKESRRLRREEKQKKQAFLENHKIRENHKNELLENHKNEFIGNPKKIIKEQIKEQIKEKREKEPLTPAESVLDNQKKVSDYLTIKFPRMNINYFTTDRIAQICEGDLDFIDKKIKLFKEHPFWGVKRKLNPETLLQAWNELSEEEYKPTAIDYSKGFVMEDGSIW